MKVFGKYSGRMNCACNEIKMPVKTYEPLQLSAEEFVANVEAARNRSRTE